MDSGKGLSLAVSSALAIAELLLLDLTGLLVGALRTLVSRMSGKAKKNIQGC